MRQRRCCRTGQRRTSTIFFELGYPGYWLSFDPETHARHARLVREAESRQAPLTVDTEPLPARAVTEVTVYCADHAGLFSRFPGRWRWRARRSSMRASTP